MMTDPKLNGIRVRRRHSSGNMITMTALVAGLVLLACMVGFALYLLLSQQKRGQSKTDTVTMTIAEFLNKDDKIGQMNNVVARCRELVYVSRQNDDLARANAHGVLTALSNQLLDESRASALFVEAERKNEIKYLAKVTKETVESYNLHTPTKSTFSLPWFETKDPLIDEVDFGFIKKTQSNVINTEGIPSLRDLDTSRSYFEPGSQLYKGNLNAKLPDSDADLDFKLSSLPAEVGSSIAPARLTNPEVFVPTAQIFLDGQFQGKMPDQLPSSVQILQHMDVSIKNDPTSVEIGSTATTNGAKPAP